MSKDAIHQHNDSFDAQALDREGEFDESPSEDEWLFTYADMITLLLTFFVLIISVSEVSQTKMEMLKESMNETLLISDNPELTPFKDLSEKLDKVVDNLKLNNQIEISKKAEGVYVELKDKVLYTTGSAEIKSESRRVLKELVKVVREMNLEDLLVEVSGYTDSLPIKSAKYESNWELSAHRATNVVKYLISMGISPRSVKAVAYADSRQKRLDPDRDYTAQEIRNLNRRIVIGIIRPLL
ncbi:MAG: OmpA family protein [Legionellales bacterium]|nr:OmpA family protein [Legionellales bacterium]